MSSYLGLAATAEHHRRHTLRPHGDRADVGRQHEGLAPAEGGRGSTPCTRGVSGSPELAPTLAIAVAPAARHSTHARRAKGCDAAVEGGATAAMARVKGWRGGVAYEATSATQTRRYSIIVEDERIEDWLR